MSIKKNDTVYVIAGREKGKKGKIEKVLPTADRVIIAGVNLRKRSIKPTQAKPRGGIVEFAGSMHKSNVMIVCPHCDKITRIAMIIGKDGKKYRSCKHCQGSLDNN